jgi:hypothetical protein
MTIRFHTSIVNACREASYDIDDTQLSKLVRTKAGGDAVASALGDDYFRVLLRRAKNRSYTSELTDLESVGDANKGMNKVVNDTLWTPDIQAREDDAPEEKARKTKERQSVTGFARSAACVLRKYVKLGGTLASLDPAIHGKNAVEKLAAELAEADAPAKTPESQIAARLASLMTALERLSTEDKAKAYGEAARCIATIGSAFPA